MPTLIAPLARVLIVEDHLDQRQSLASFFEGDGYQVHEAETGSQALHMIHELRFSDRDLVLLDVRLPGEDGFAVLKKIKIRPVIFFMTGYEDVDLATCYEAGASVVFKKPFDAKLLLAAAKRHLQEIKSKAPPLKSRNGQNREEIRLSPREEEVLALVTDGYSSDQIASILGISAQTVAVHRKSIRNKYKGRNFIEIVQIHNKVAAFAESPWLR